MLLALSFLTAVLRTGKLPCVFNIERCHCTANGRGKEKVPFKDKSAPCCQATPEVVQKNKKERKQECAAQGSLDFNVPRGNPG